MPDCPNFFAVDRDSRSAGSLDHCPHSPSPTGLPAAAPAPATRPDDSLDSRRPFDLVIFDLDGTLVDTRDAIADTFQAVIGRAGHPVPKREEVLPLIGLPLEVMFRRFLPLGPGEWAEPLAGRRHGSEDASTASAETGPIEGATEREISDLIAAYRKLYHETVTPRTKAFAGVAETLLALGSLGLLLAVATSKLTSIAVDALSAAWLLSPFSRVYGMDAAERPKPAPDLALRILAELAIPASRTLVVGDAASDVEMGRAAGCATCAVTYGAQSRQDLVLVAPDFIVDDISEVFEIVRG